ncbi:MAG: ATP-binding protein [Mycoplasmataceae bacterium]|nr:ATP-binding protein [Mycoplasmataceae bacterium]
MPEYYREKYVKQLESEKNSHFIKILIGIRRSGKSTILNQYINTFKKNENIIQFDFNDLKLKKMNYEKLYDEILKVSKRNEINYLFLDEIQEIDKWEECVISLFENKMYKYDIYITGSNSKLLSTELSTLLTGRHSDIRVMPLTFKEFHEISNMSNENDELNKYIEIGGLGIIIPFIEKQEKIRNILVNVLNDTIDKDIKKRHKINNNNMINKLMEYVLNNIGKDISTTQLEKYFKKTENKHFSYRTMDSYLQWMCDAMLLYRVNYFNVKTKTILKTTGKYYAGDLGLLHMNISNDQSILGYQIENVVLLQLISEGYKVYTAEIYQKNKENKGIDFVAIKEGKIKYIQVTYELNDNNIKRECDSLLLTKDAYEKIIIFVNAKAHPLNNGVKTINLVNWLLKKTEL